MSRRRLRSTVRSVATLALFALVGWVLGGVFVDAFLDPAAEGRHPMGVLLLLPGLALVGFLVLAIHETGHLLGGRLVGFRPLLLLVGPLRVEWQLDRWRLGLNRSLGLWGGLAASAPMDDRDLRRRSLAMVAGGPSTSILAGLALVVLLQWLPLPPPGSGDVAELPSLLLTLLGAGSIVIGLVTLIPGRTSGFDTDGARILRLARGGPVAEGEAALLAVMGRSMAGERPRDWDPELVRQALACPPDSSIGLAARQMAHVHALDRGEAEEARRHLEAALEQREKLSPVLRAPLLGQAAYFSAVHLDDGARGRRLLAEADGRAIGPRYTISLGEAAVLLAECDQRGAARLVERAREELRVSVDRGMAAAVGSWTEELARLLEESGSDAAGARGRSDGAPADALTPLEGERPPEA